MLLHGLAALLFDESGWYNSPFMIPIAGCAMIGCIVVAAIWSGVRTREIRSAERMAMIARGLSPEPDWESDAQRQAPIAAPPPSSSFRSMAAPSDGAGAQRAGLVLSAIGVGLILFFAVLAVVVRVREVLSGSCAGILPLAIGVGFLIDARLRRQAYERWLDRQPVAAAAAAPFAAGPPPPPPAEAVPMTPAQASDWRPLH